MSRFGFGNEEELYDNMFSSSMRYNDDDTREDAEVSAWYLNDLMLGKHVEENFNYDDYDTTTVHK